MHIMEWGRAAQLMNTYLACMGPWVPKERSAGCMDMSFLIQYWTKRSKESNEEAPQEKLLPLLLKGQVIRWSPCSEKKYYILKFSISY